jgi:pimeloyl-ACP methyl ester carboxylesterase
MHVANRLIAAAILAAAGGMTGGTSAGELATKQELAAAAKDAEKSKISSVRGLVGDSPCTVDIFEVSGCPAFLVRPKDVPADSRTPWVWYAPVLGNPSPNPGWMAQQWLAKGIGIAGINVGESMGNPRGRQIFTAFWQRLTTHYNMSPKACLLAQSRGGLMHYNWAAENPSRVACIAGIYAVCDLRCYPKLKRAAEAYGLSEAEMEAQLAKHNPIDRLTPLAAAHVPILHIQGDVDKAVPLDKNSGEMDRRYRALGGQMKLIVVPGKGHEACDEFFHRQEMVDFVVAHARAK